MKPARVELLCVGSELLSGRLNTHLGKLALALNRAGLSLSREATLPDDRAMIAAEIGAALERSDAVLVCGGLGPTFDDLTREAASHALGRPLVFKKTVWARILERFKRHGHRRVPAENKRQAEVLTGARVLANENGSAPGQLLRLPGPKTLALLPGPWNELWPIFTKEVLPALKRAHARGVHAAAWTVRLSGIPESAADAKLAPLTQRPAPGLSYTILAGAGQVDFHAFARAKSAMAAARLVAGARRRALAAVGAHAYGEGNDTLEAAAGRLLKASGLTLSIAESCTGGLLGGRITAVPGSSAWFRGGVIAYHDDLKRGLLGVPAATLAKHGAVSRACAESMAEGARLRCAASLGLAVTGIAGPSGGTRKKPVGLVFIALAGPGNMLLCREHRFVGNRAAVRERAAAAALDMLVRRLQHPRTNSRIRR